MVCKSSLCSRDLGGNFKLNKMFIYAIINHNNFKQKATVWFPCLKVLEDTFCVGAKTKHDQPGIQVWCIRETPYTLLLLFVVVITPVKVCGVCPRRQKILGRALLRPLIIDVATLWRSREGLMIKITRISASNKPINLCPKWIHQSLWWSESDIGWLILINITLR